MKILSTPFWEFLKSYEYNNESVKEILKLSTPFWEFRQSYVILSFYYCVDSYNFLLPFGSFG